MENGEHLEKEQVEQIENEYRERVEHLRRSDAAVVLSKEEKARQKAAQLLSREGLAQLGRQIILLYDMLREWWDGKWDMPWKTAAAIVGALLYFINPFDIVPDFVPLVGYLDDMVVIGACFRLIQSDLREYATYKKLNLDEYGL